MKKFNTKRISFLVLAPLAILLLLVIVVAAYAYVALRNDMDKIQFETLKSIERTSKETLDHRHAGAEMTADLFNDDYQTFYDAVAEMDTFNMAEELRWSMSASQGVGYVFTDMDGFIICCSFKDVQMDVEQIQQIAQKTIAANRITATGTFVGSGVADYTSVLVKNNEDEELGIVILVTYLTSSEKSTDAINEQMGSDSFIFRGDKCIVSTNQAYEPESLVLDPEVSENCYERGIPWAGVSYFTGSRGYYSAVPLKDLNNKTIACILIRSNSTTTDMIMRSVAFLVPFAIIIFSIVFFLLAFRLKRSLIDPIDDLVAGVNKIATGDLTQAVETRDSCQEVTQLAISVREMENKIRRVLLPIHDTAEALMNSANQLSGASESLSNAANRQAASLEEISSSMEQMGANIQQNTDNSVHTNKLTEEVSSMAAKLGTASGNSYEAIQNIAKNINDINDLVSQTNILALNASVEAARAGEHGQGFGVVAKEVGRLAEQTHETADSINATATSSINEAEEAYNQTQQLTPRIEKIANLVKEITTASVEQSSGVSQVNSAILDLNRVTQQNAAGAEEIAASTMQMRDMINDLNTAVAIFKL